MSFIYSNEKKEPPTNKIKIQINECLRKTDDGKRNKNNHIHNKLYRTN